MSEYAVPLNGSGGSDVGALIDEQQQLWNADGTWREHMADIAEITRPIAAELRGKLTDGAKRMSKVFDGTAIGAAVNMGNGVYATANNPADVWFTVGTDDPDLNKWKGVSAYLQRRSARTLASFGPAYSAFYSQSPSTYYDVAAFGTGFFSSEIRADRSGFIDMARPLSEMTFDVDGENCLNKVFRRWSMTAAAAVAMFPNSKGNFSAKLLNEKDPNAKFEFIHAIVPNPSHQPGMLGPNGKAFTSTYIEVAEKRKIEETGFYEMPYFACRWEISSGEKRGRGAGEHAYPDNRSLQVQTKANLAAGEFAASPPIGAPSRDEIEAMNWGVNKVIYGAYNSQGRRVVGRLVDNINVPFATETQKVLQQAVKDAFYFQLMQVQGRTGMTPIEWMDFQEERMRFLAPHLGRITTDYLHPLVDRRGNQLERAVPNIFGPKPASLAGHTLKPIFQSPLALAQRSQRAAATMRVVTGVQQVMAIDPSAGARFNGDKAVEIISSAVPELLNDDDTTAQNKARIAAAQQAATTAQVAQPMADAADKGASAIATLQQARTAQPAPIAA